MEALQPILVRVGGVVDGRVVADESQLAALQAETAIGLGPPSVVTDRHAHHPAKAGVHPKAVSGLEVVALQMLEGPPRLVVLVAGQVDLAISADHRAVALHEDRRVVAMPVGGQFGIPEVEAHAQSSSLVEQGLSFGPGHLRLIEPVGLGQVFDPPPREEGCQGKFGEDDQVASRVGPLAE